MRFRKWLEETEAVENPFQLPKGSIIAFDFDSTLTKTVLNKGRDFGSPEPYPQMISTLKKHAALGHKVVIVTGRKQYYQSVNRPDRVSVEDFVKKYNLPVSAIYYSGQEPSGWASGKGPFLQQHGISVLYDDTPEQVRSAKEYGVMGILVPRQFSSHREFALPAPYTQLSAPRASA
jgi:acid phosphatase class B